MILFLQHLHDCCMIIYTINKSTNIVFILLYYIGSAMELGEKNEVCKCSQQNYFGRAKVNFIQS